MRTFYRYRPLALLILLGALGIWVEVRWGTRTAYGWMRSPASPNYRHLLQIFLHYIVPPLALTHTALAAIQWRTARNDFQRAITRFLTSKAFFWYVVWLSFHEQRTNGWITLYVFSLSWIAVTLTGLLVRVLRRYVFVQHDGTPPAIVPAG